MSMTIDNSWGHRADVAGLLPAYSPIKITSGLDRYGFSSVLAKRCGHRLVRRSFANWVHGWIWTEKPTAELLACAKLPKNITIVVRNPIEKIALEAEDFTDIRVGGLPFAYIERQHTFRNENSLLAFPPHSAEVERVSNPQIDYLDFLETIRNDFESIYLSIYYLDIDGPLHKAANQRGLKVIRGARPDDANSLLRTRSMLDSFTYVTSNVMGSHMLYALFAGCKFSFCGPMYGYDESEFLAGGNPLGHSSDYIRMALQLQSENYLREKFSRFFVSQPHLGIADGNFASESIGKKFLMNPHQIENALGWSNYGQMEGYLSGALRRSTRLFGEIIKFK